MSCFKMLQAPDNKWCPSTPWRPQLVHRAGSVRLRQPVTFGGSSAITSTQAAQLWPEIR
jgi:hypothetical protein